MAPTPAEIATYEGLHAAAASGSVVEIDRLVKQGAASMPATAMGARR